MYKLGIPTEDLEQRHLAVWLDSIGVLWQHSPNGGLRNKAVAAKLRRHGVKRGVPDVMIYDPPNHECGYVGVAVELKRIRGGSVTPDQEWWMSGLAKNSWYTIVARGAEDAIKKLTAIGYGR